MDISSILCIIRDHFNELYLDMPKQILQLPKTTTVLYSSKPLTGTNDIIEHCDPQEFASKHGFEWHDDLYIDDSLIEKYESMKSSLPRLASGYLLIKERSSPGTPIDEGMIGKIPSLDQIVSMQEEQAKIYLEEIKINAPNLVVCANPKVGNGLHWRGPGIIKKGTAVIHYSAGIMDALSPTYYSSYLYSVHGHPLFKDLSVSASGTIDGLHGGLARFVQHAPDRQQLSECYSFKATVQTENIATANVELLYLLYQGMPLVVLVATEDIQPNSQIFFDYELSYWAITYGHSGIQPLLFNKQSEILDSSSYEKLFIFLKINDEMRSLSFKNIFDSVSGRLDFESINTNDYKKNKLFSYNQLMDLVIAELKQQNIIPGIDTPSSILLQWLETVKKAENSELSYQEEFKTSIYSILLKYRLENTFKQNTQKIDYIDKILKAAKTSTTASSLYSSVRTTMNYGEDKDFYTKQLSPMRVEIVAAMQAYYKEQQSANQPKQVATQSSSPSF